jgi:sulfur relay (sulfurtransferase) DsrC/TusE family protein
MKKQDLPTIANFNLKIDLQKLQKATDELAAKFVDVKTANPMLCDNHMELVSQVYDNFEQINLTTPIHQVLKKGYAVKKNIFIMFQQKIMLKVILKKL